MEGTLFKHLSEIDQACNERTEIIISAMAKQEGVTEALKATDQMEWVCRMNSIHNRAEEIVLSELVYHRFAAPPLVESWASPSMVRSRPTPT